MKLHTTDMNKTEPEEDILQKTFSDINSNIMTTEARCTEFMRYYSGLPQDSKGKFLCNLAQKYGMDKNGLWSIAKTISSLTHIEDPSLLTAAERMRAVLRPKHKTLFTHIGRVNGGVKFLVDLRADILNFKQSNNSEINAALYQELNSTLRELLLLWFTVGFLNLERITWSSPCDLVQKVSNYEAVHRIRTWTDIKQRVGPYRRCYIFTHNAMPREPVVVLHTALTSEISSNIQSIIYNARFRPSLSSLSAEDSFFDSSTSVARVATNYTIPTSPITPVSSPPATSTVPFNGQMKVAPPEFPNIQAVSMKVEEREDPSQVKAAVFYSITSTQRGLNGIEMGNYLIKSVVRKLQEEFPNLQEFSSLSPIPGFRDWLLAQVKHNINLYSMGEDPGVPLLLPTELSALEVFKQPNQKSTLETFKDLLESHKWYQSSDVTQVMISPLMRLCANYLYVQKRRSYALNPVANFHLSNGAMLWRINFLADTSPRGLQQSCAMMVNYRYYLDLTDLNSRAYLERHQISVSPEVLTLLQGGSKTSAS